MSDGNDMEFPIPRDLKYRFVVRKKWKKSRVFARAPLTHMMYFGASVGLLAVYRVGGEVSRHSFLHSSED